MPFKNSVHTQLCLELEDQDPDPQALLELLSFYAIDDRTGQQRVDINALIQGLDRVLQIRISRREKEAKPEPAPAEAAQLRITGKAKDGILQLLGNHLQGSSSTFEGPTSLHNSAENAAAASELSVDQSMMSTLMMAEAIDLANLTLPIGTSVCYIEADEDDPASFQVPAWSLRAIALKRKRVQEELSSGVIRKLGAHGEPIHRTLVQQRSLAHQDGILAHALMLQAKGEDPTKSAVANSLSRNITLQSGAGSSNPDAPSTSQNAALAVSRTGPPQQNFALDEFLR